MRSAVSTQAAATDWLAHVSAEFQRRPGVYVVAIVVALVHLATQGRYDAHRNELYFLACGWRPDFGYVDQPPLVPLIAAATQIFGESIWLLRLPATVVGVGLVLLCAAFARLVGGRERAEFVAALAAGIAPGLMGLSSKLTTSTFEPIAWTGAAYLLTRAILNNRPRDIVSMGVVAGLAMEAKWGIAVWLVALAAGVVATPARRIVLQPQVWIGASVAIALAAPNLIWQWTHGWPFFDVILPHLESQKDYAGNPLEFMFRQAQSMNLALAPLWLAGAVAPFVLERLRSLRFLAIAFVLTCAFYGLKHGTNYYLFPVYPTMFALGAVAVEGLWTWALAGWLAMAFAFSAQAAPVVLPILDPPALLRYMEFMRIKPRPIEAASVGAPITHGFSDELGWRDMVKSVATVFRSLPAEDQAKAAILAANYGEAAALDVYGPAEGLPTPISGHNQYWLWGPRGHDGSVVLYVGGNLERWRPLCRSVEVAGAFGGPYVMPYENRQIILCRGMRRPLDEMWPRLKRFR
jgi:hypothetical protein